MMQPARPQAEGLSVEAAFAELREHLVNDSSLIETLDQVTALTKRVVPEATEVSITLVAGDRARTATFTGPLAARLDERQYETGFGPCLAAATSGQTIRTWAEDPDNPYPEFAQACYRSGVRHTLSVAMPVPGRVVGAINLYGAGPDAFSDESEATAGTFAGYAAVTIANVALYADAVDLATQLQIAMESRAVIEQAKGIVMAQNGCTADDAFMTLARLSQTRNVKLRDLAQEMVRRARSRGRHPAS